MKQKMRLCALLLALLLLAGCGQSPGNPAGSAGTPAGSSSSADASTPTDSSLPEGNDDVDIPADAFVDPVELGFEQIEIEDEAVALAASAPATPSYLKVSAPGTQANKNAKAVLDYSNSRDGYVMVQFTASTTKRVKALVKGPTTQYQYNLTPGKWDALPLSDGNGAYTVGIYENVKDTSYACVLSQNLSVAMTDEFAPFLRSNQYVNFEAAPATVAKAAELCGSLSRPLDKVGAVYNFVVKGLTYDKQLAATVQSGYLPVLDTVLARKTGICFDYAAVMTGMLRSQGVPCKLVVGYAGSAYHAWISVWSQETGWIEGAVYFNGSSWQRMDPTFASSGKQSESIMKYIGDGKNYSAKYFY